MPSLLATTVPSYSSRTRSLPANILQQGRRQSTLANIVLRKKNEVDVVLEGSADYVHSYSTYDEISGNVELRLEKDTPIDDLVITFEGQTATYVEKIATTAPTTGRTTGKHTFLKLLQPLEGDDLPADRILRGGETYKVPFLFNVPDRLLPYVCSHKVDNGEVRKHHTQLPPSLGDPSTSGDGNTLMDDLAPSMSKISYGIRARVTQRLAASNKVVEIAEKIERIRLVPQRDEEPPVAMSDEADFCLRKEKSVKKGLFKIGKVGRITAETVQPKSFRLSHPSKKVNQPITTITTINLRFDPLSPEDMPPSLGNLATKMRIYTFFGAAPYKILPEIFRCDNWSSLHGVYPESLELSSRNLSTVSWTKHDPSSRSSSTSSAEDLSRRPSAYSTLSAASSIPEPSSAYTSNSPFYTAQVLVPVSLPDPHTSKNPKVFVPSFHSCIVSRTYTLEFNLAYHASTSNVGNAHIVLKTPVQISQEGGTPPAVVDESDEQIVAEIERQFGLYEQQQLEHELGLESPAYEVEDRPLIDRRGTVAGPIGIMPRAGLGSIPEQRRASQSNAPPPEYQSLGVNRRRTAENVREVQVGPARTQSVSASDHSSVMHTSSGASGYVYGSARMDATIARAFAW